MRGASARVADTAVTAARNRMKNSERPFSTDIFVSTIDESYRIQPPPRCGCPTKSRTEQLTRVDVSLGDVSINKVPPLVAADQGLSAKYGLDVHQTISA